MNSLLDNQPIVMRNNAEKPERLEIHTDAPKIFISYSWDDEEHKEWVLNLANELIANGVDVLLDRYELKLGHNLFHFMEQSLLISNKVLIILTPNYKIKADGRKGGVGYEYSILNSDLYNKILDNDKYIPVLRRGDTNESVPGFMQQFIRLDMKDNGEYITQFKSLLRAIFNEPELTKPPLGPRPAFTIIISRREEMKRELYTVLDKINPVIRKEFANGTDTVGVMVSLSNVAKLESIKEEIEKEQLLAYRSNGNIIMGGTGNRIGNHINDISEGVMQGFILKKLQYF